MDVGIVGGSGYAGGELVRLLAGHPALKLRVIAGASSAVRPLAEVFPQALGALGEGVVAAADIDALSGLDVVFLATPVGPSLELAPALAGAGQLVVDLSAAFRLPPEVFVEAYGIAHTSPALTPATYALPERHREAIRATGQRADGRLVAVPGCYPTATALALLPLGQLLDPTTVVVTGMSGTSGAGKALRENLHASHVMGNIGAYGAPGHRHTPEIEQVLADLADLAAPPPVSFTPHLLPMPRGLVATVVAEVADGVEGGDVVEAVRSAYADEPFVHAVAGWPQAAHVVGGNGAHVAAALDDRTHRVTASCAIDNLLKGAAGQAVQAANLALGLPETAGLSAVGVYP